MAWEILKWVLLVLAAGFVGYFGRHLAMVVIRRLGEEKSESRGNREGTLNSGDDNAGMEKERLKARAKLEKKRLKAEIKKEKS